MSLLNPQKNSAAPKSASKGLLDKIKDAKSEKVFAPIPSANTLKGEKPPVFPSYKGLASEAASAAKRKIQTHAATFNGRSNSVFGGSLASSPPGSVLAAGEDFPEGAPVEVPPGNVMRDGEGATHLQAVTKACFNKDASLCVTGGAEGTVRVWGVKEGQPRRTIEMVKDQPRRISALDINTAGKFVLVGDWGYRVKVFDVNTGLELMAMAGHDGKVTCGRFEKQSKMIATGGEDKVVRVWDPREPKGKCMKFKAPDEVLDCAFSPDGAGLLLANKSNDMWLYDSRKNDAPLRKYEGHKDWVNCCVYDAEGKHILSGSQDKTAKLWNAASGEVVCDYEHETSVNSASFFGSNTVVTAQGNRFFQSKSNKIVLWKRKEAEALCEVEGHTDAVLHVDVHLATRQMVTASMDRTARVWQIPGKKNRQKKRATAKMCRFGCGNLLSEDAMEEHERGCPMRDVKCEACGAEVEAVRLEAHSRDECPQRSLTCECGVVVVASQTEAHSKDGCPVVKVKCDLCGGMVQKGDLEDHARSACPQRRVDCALGCGKRFSACHVFKHEASECPHRLETCPDCDEAVEQRAVAHHRERQCAARVIACRKCGAEVSFMLGARHDASECPKRNAPCALCGGAVPMDEHEEHQVYACCKRLVPCDHLLRGCFDKVAFDALAAHVAQCPFAPGVEPEASSDETVASPDAQQEEEPEITTCQKCTFSLKVCPKCSDKFCPKCMTVSGLPNKGLCKTCTRQAILAERKSSSTSQVKMKF